jgi:hypothetical protein
MSTKAATQAVIGRESQVEITATVVVRIAAQLASAAGLVRRRRSIDLKGDTWTNKQ